MKDYCGRLIVFVPRLSGTVNLSGAKNSALRHLAANLLDAQVHVEMLEVLDMRADLQSHDDHPVIGLGCTLLAEVGRAIDDLRCSGGAYGGRGGAFARHL